MVLELHIWGPAFGLPSIDASCLATVAYFHQCVPPTEWRLIPSSDPSVGPKNELPALKSDSTWVCGFSKIVEFVRRYSSEKWDLDRDLDEKQRADCIAFSSFLESRGQPLLDVSLFVSSENYSQWTRPALAQILHWPGQWIVPHRLLDEAKRRSEHLGLSSLDIETTNEEDGGTKSRGVGNIPKSLVTKSKETVATVLGKTGGQTQFRLDSVTSDALEPLCDLVRKHGSQSWVFGTDKASSLDCLLLGYVSLMSPPLRPPRQWLQDALSTRYPAVLQWATNFRQECFGGPHSAADVLSMSRSDPPYSSILPWHSPAPLSAADAGLMVLAAIYDALPIASFRSDRVVRAAPPEAVSGTAATWLTVQNEFYPVGLVCSALGAMLGYGFYAGLVGLRRRSTQHARHVTRFGGYASANQRDFGEAGRILGFG